MRTIAFMMMCMMVSCATGESSTAFEQGLICDPCDPGDAQAYLRDLVGHYGSGQFAGAYQVGGTTCHVTGGVSYCNATYGVCTDQGCGNYTATCDSLGSQDCWWGWD